MSNKEKNNQTTITDICHFESPLGILGHLFNRLVLTTYMTKFLEERNSIIKEFAESEKWKAILNHSNPK